MKKPLSEGVYTSLQAYWQCAIVRDHRVPTLAHGREGGKSRRRGQTARHVATWANVGGQERIGGAR